MLLQRRLVRQQVVERAVQSILIDLGGRHAQQIRECTAVIDVLGQVGSLLGAHNRPSTTTIAIAGQRLSPPVGPQRRR